MNRWHLECEHHGPDGVLKFGGWFPDHASMFLALLRLSQEGYYTVFTLRKGSGPVPVNKKYGLASGVEFPARSAEPA